MRSAARLGVSWLALSPFVLGCTVGTVEHVPEGTGPEPGPVVAWRKSPPVSPLYVGSGGFGYAFGSATVSAVAPQGLVKVGPDTKGPWGTIRFLHFAGYYYGDDTVLGFSHLHLHGTGATDYGVLALMPAAAFDPAQPSAAGHASTFAKDSESAVPGRYGLTLDRGGIDVALTATPHAAHHRYTYPAGSAAAHVILDLDHHLDGGSVTSAELSLDAPAQRLRGRLHSLGGMSGGYGGYDVFFAARARAPWAEALVWHDGAAPAPGLAASGAGVGAALAFDPAAPVEIQLAVSMVSVDEAEKNLAAELPGWDFDGTAAQTAAAWDALLGAVRYEGGTPEQRIMMDASLYHLYLMPSVHSDVSGAYRGTDGAVHTAEGYRHVSDLSLWDTYRTLHPLYALISPDRALDAVRSLHAMAQQGGFFPKWPLASGDAGSMIGASAEIVVADAFVKGLTDFDADGAYALLRAAAMDPTPPPGGRGGRDHVEPYLTLGYVPNEAVSGSVSRTTEFANDDLALANLAEGLGHAADAAALRARGTGYRKLLDPENGFLWGRAADGTWPTDHADPARFSDEYVEANAWQSLWMVALDVDGLAAASGGRAALVSKLEQMFELTREHHEQIDFDNPLLAGSLRPYYWHGNEPDLDAAYLFALLGRPSLTQKWVAWIRSTQYTPGADGVPGNDDGGTMGAWFVWSALGLYPLAGSDRYVLGAPLFEKAVVHVAGGELTILAPGVSDTNIYVEAVEWNGAPRPKAELRHADLAAGGTLVFHMGPGASRWGAWE
jgi:predicted alpha-1,2-mannosidase